MLTSLCRAPHGLRVLLVLSLLSTIASAATVTWTGSAGNNLWSDPANWSTGALPGASDDVVIPVGSTTGIIYVDGSRPALTSLSITGAGSLNFATSGTSNQIVIPTITIASGATVNFNATLGAGAVTVGGGGTILLDSQFNQNGNITVDGTVAGTQLKFVNRAPLNNAPGSLGTARGDLPALGTAAGTAETITLTNGGILSMAGSGANPDGSTKIVSLGAGGGGINVATGSIYNMDDAGQIIGAGGLTKTGNGRLVFNTQDYALAGNATVNAGFLEVRGNTTTGTFSTASTFTVNGGVLGILTTGTGIVGNGGITLNSGGSLGVTGGDREFGAQNGTTAITLNGGNILAFDYLDGSARNPRINNYVQGSGTINLVGGGASRAAVVFQRYDAAQSTFNGRYIVGDNVSLENNGRASATANTGAALGLGTVELKGFNAQLDIRDNGAGSNGSLAYGNNVEITNTEKGTFQTLRVSQASANTGNLINLGTLTMGADRYLTVNSVNNYRGSFAGAVFQGNAVINTTATGNTLGGLTFLDNAGTDLSEATTGRSFTKIGRDTSAADTSQLNVQDALRFTNVNAVEGTLNVSGANGVINVGAVSGTGTLNLSTAATLRLDDSTTVAAGQRIGSAVQTIANGGTISVQSNTAAASTSDQIIGNFNLASGMLTADATRNNAGALSVLELGSAGNTAAFTRATSATVNFTGTSLGTTGNTGRILLTGQATTGFLGAWASSGTEFVKYDATLDSGFALGVTPLTTADYTLNPTEAGYTTGLNVKASNATATTVTLAGARAVNSLNLQGAGATTLALGGNALTLESGGLLSSTSAHLITGTATSSLTAGTTSSATPLFVNVTSSTLDIGARITNNAASGVVSLVKTGAGTLILSNTAAAASNNSFTGGVVINSGILSAFSPNALGTNAIQLAGGQLTANSNNVTTGTTIAWGNNITVTANGSSLLLDNNTVAANGSNTNQLITFGTLTFNAPPTGSTAATLFFGGFDQVDTRFTGVTLANTPTISTRGNDSNSTLTFAGVMSGSGGINFAGTAGEVTEFGSGTADTAANTYTGDVGLFGGARVVLNKANNTTAITGDVVINGGTLTFKRAGQENQLAAGSKVYLYSGALGVNPGTNVGTMPRDFSGVVPEVIMKGGELNSGWGSLQVNKATISGGAITVQGTYDVGGTLILNDTVLLHGAPNINVTGGGVLDTTVLSLGGAAGFSTVGQNIVLNQGTPAFSAGSVVNLSTNIIVGADPLIAGSYSSGITVHNTVSNTIERDARLDLQGGTRTFDISTAGTFFTIQPNIVNGGLTKNGNGTLILSSFLNSSTFDGAFTINAGVVNARNNTSFGSTAGATTVVNGATLELEAGLITGENFTLSGNGSVTNSKTAALVSLQGANRLTGSVTLDGGASISSWGHNAVPDAGFPALTAVQNFTNYSDLRLSGAITGTGDLTLRGDGRGTLSGDISSSGGLIKDGAGVWAISGSNSYAGLTDITAGTLAVSNSNALGNTGTGTRVLGGATLELSGGIAVGSEALELHGAGFTKQRGALVNASGNNSFGGDLTLVADPLVSAQNTNVVIASQAGKLTLSGVVAPKTGTDVNLIITGSGNVEFSNSLSTNAGTLIKNGNGILTLSSSTAGGGIGGAASINGGTLSINTASEKLSDTAALNLAGGNLTLTGSGTETVGSINLTSGGAEISLGSATLTSAGALTRSAGATANFTTAGNVSAASGLANTNGILGAWATVGGSNWATVSGASVGALSTYVTLDEDLGQPASATVVPPLVTDNLLIDTTLQNTTTTAISANSLKIAGTNVRGIGQNSLNLTLASGGLLYDGTVGSTAGLAGTGTLAQGSGGEMIFQVKDGTLDVGMIVAGTNGLTKDGTGTLVLSGANTFTGNININGGTLAIIGPGGTTDPTTLGAVGARTITLNGGTFSLLAGVFDPAVSTKSFVIGDAGGTINVQSGDGQSGSSYGTLIINDASQLSGTGTLTKTGGGRIIVGAVTYGFSGDVNILGGVLETQASGSLGLNQAQQTITIGNGARFDNGAGDLSSRIIVQDGGTLGARGNTTHILRGDIEFQGNSTITLKNTTNFGQAENYEIEGKVTQAAGATLNVVAFNVGNPLTLGNAANDISGTIKLEENATLLAIHAGTLGSNTAARATIEMDANTRLRLMEDTTADFNANVKTNGNVLVDVRSAVAANSGHILSLNNLDVAADSFFTTSGGNSFQLRFAGTSVLNGGSADVTKLDIGSQGLIFDGALTSTAGVVEKFGTGQLILRGTSSFGGEMHIQAGDVVLRQSGTLTGVTKLVIKGGRLLSDNTEDVNTDRIPNAAAIDLYGGQIYNSNNETIGALTLNGFAGQIRESAAGTLTGPQVLTISSLTRNLGGGANFANEGGGTLGATGNNPRIVITGMATSTFMGGAYTVNADWAQYSATVDSGSPRGVLVMNSYSSNPTETSLSSTLTGTATNHVNLSSANLTLTASRDIGSLRFDTGSGARSVALGTNTLSVQSGGILQTGANAASITGTGNLTVNGDGTSAGELFMHIQGATTTVDAKITNNGTGAVTLVKNGGSNLVLTNVNNDFTGGLYLNQGTITITSAGTANNQPALGSVAGSDIYLQGGTLAIRHDAGTVAAGVVADGHDLIVRANSTLTVDKSTIAAGSDVVVNPTLAMGSLTIDDALFTVRNNIDNTTGRTSANYNVSFTGGNMAGVAILDWARNVQSNIVSTGSSTGPGTATAPASRLTITGNITGAAGSEFYKNGESTLVLGGGATDTVASDWLTDITLNAGTTFLNKADGFSAINGNITLNGGNLTAGSESTLTGVGANQIADTSVITLNAGTVNFLGRNETIAGLVMNGGLFRSDSDGATGLTGNKVVITGNALINAVGDNSGLLADVASFINIGGNLTVGPQGRVTAGASGTLNVAGTVELNGATIRISSGSGASNFGLNGTVTTLANGQPAVFDGQDDSDSFLNLNAAGSSRVFNVADGLATDDLIVSVKMRDGASLADGSGTTSVAANQSGFTKDGAGKMVLRGATNNLFTGVATVAAGTLELAKTAGQNSISGSELAISSGALVQQRTSNQIADTATITNNGTWDLDFGNASDTVGKIQGSTAGAEIRVGPGSSITTNFTGTASYAGAIVGSGISSAATGALARTATTPLPTAGAVIKQGTGVWDLTGDSQLSGTVLVAAGEVSMNGSMTGNTVYVQGTSVLSGKGSLAANDGVLSNVVVQSGASISPGNAGASLTSIGMLTVKDDLRTLSGANINLNINGNTLNDGGLMAAYNAGSAAYDAYVTAAINGWESTLTNGVASTNHDRLSIMGDYQHDTGAKTNVTFLSGYTPVVGDVFDLYDWATLNLGGYAGTGALLTTTGAGVYGNGLLTAGGTLGDLNLPTLSGGLLWDVQKFQSHGVLIVVPEPSRALLVLGGFVGLLMRRRRK